MLNEDLNIDPNADQENLRSMLIACHDCVQRCQTFYDSFQRLRQDGNAGEAIKWVWKDKEMVKLRQEIDGQISNINLNLSIKHLYDH